MTVDRLLNPRSVAVIGASPEVTKPSGMVLNFLGKSVYAGKVYPINPKYPSIGKWTCYPSLKALPEKADLAVIAVPSDAVIDVLQDCADAGVAGALVMTGGFGEGGTGEAGEQRRQRLEALTREKGLRVIGPNTVGMVNFTTGLPLTFADWYSRDTGARDKIAILTQSGSMGGLIFSSLQKVGVGVNFWIGLGNETDLEAADLIEYFAGSDDVNTVVCYLEGLKDGERFIQAAAKLRAAGKDLVVLRAGRSPASQRSTLSHTGKMSGSAKIFEAVFREIGAIDAASLSETIYILKLLRVRRKRPAGVPANTVGVISASGGICSIVADHASDNGLEVPTLSAASREGLTKVIPDFGSHDNPVDVSANVISRVQILTGTLDVLKDNKDVANWVIFGRPILDRYHAQIAEAAPGFNAEVIACSGVGLTSEVEASFVKAGIPHVEDPEQCMRALGRLAKTAVPSTHVISRAERAKLRRELGGEAVVGQRIYDALHKYGAPMPVSHFVDSSDAARKVAGSLSYPVAVKSASSAIPHKTEAGCVVLGVKDAAALDAAVARVIDNSRKAAPTAPIAIEVQQMARGKHELLLTITQDRDFGPMVVVGLGGVTAELLKDTAILTFPATSERMLTEMKNLKGWPLLNGYRGAPPADLEAFAKLFDAVSALYRAEKWIGEIEFNPVMVGARGEGAMIVDALVTVAK